MHDACNILSTALPGCDLFALGSSAPMLLTQPPDMISPVSNLALLLQAFDYAYTQLARGGSPDDSLLARVIRLDTVLTDRPQPPPLPDYVDGGQPVRHCRQLPCQALSKRVVLTPNGHSRQPLCWPLHE